MANDYVGRYGAALRQLTALERPVLPGAISPDAPQPTTGAFGQPAGPSPQAGPAFTPTQSAAPAMPPQAPTQGALPSSDPQPAPSGDQPISAAQLYKDMPDDVKDDLEKQIEAGGHDIDEVYAAKVASGEIKAPKKEPTKRDKLGYIAEVALRTISNLNRPTENSAGDWADAVLATDARRAALDERDNALFRQSTAGAFERQEKRKETRRQESRADEGALKERAGRVADTEGKQAFEMSEAEKRRKHELELAKMREAGDNARSRDAQGNLVTDDQGGLVRVKGDEATPVMTTKKVKETKRGKRGVSYTIEKEVREQVKALPKAVASDVDPDRIVSEIGDRIKALKDDGRLRRELMKQEGMTEAKADREIAKQAKEQVMAEYAIAPGGRSATPSQKEPNFFD